MMKQEVVHRYQSYNKIFKICLNICLTSLIFGYGISNFNSIAYDDIVKIYQLQEYPRATAQGLLTGCMAFMAGLGAFFSSYLLDRLSRKQCIQFLAYLTICVGITLMVPHLGFLVVGRLMQGLCVGMCSTISPLYLRQFSPIEIASQLCPYNQIFLVMGITMSFVLSFFFSLFLPVTVYWRLVFGFPIIIACFQLYNLHTYYPYETPKYLVLKGRQNEAKQLLAVIYQPEYVQTVFKQITQSMVKSVKKQSSSICCSCNQELSEHVEVGKDDKITQKLMHEEELRLIGESRPAEKQPIKTANNQLAVIMSFHLSIQQQMVGIGSIIVYSGEIVGRLLPSAEKLFPIIINIIAVVGCFAAIPIVKFLGRKKTLQYGALSISVCLLLLSHFFSSYDFEDLEKNTSMDSFMVMFLFITIRVLFGLSLGPIMFLYLSQIVQSNIMALALMMNWGTQAILNIIFPILTVWAGGNPGVGYLIFGLYTFVGFLINKRFLVETDNKTEYQIRKEFDQKWK